MVMYTLLSKCYKYLLTRPLKIKTKQVHLIIAETLWSIFIQNLHVLLKKNDCFYKEFKLILYKEFYCKH